MSSPRSDRATALAAQHPGRRNQRRTNPSRSAAVLGRIPGLGWAYRVLQDWHSQCLPRYYEPQPLRIESYASERKRRKQH